MLDPSLSDSALKRMGRLLKIKKTLRPGWHDGDGEAVTEDAMRSAELVHWLDPSFAGLGQVFPTLDGGLLFEFEAAGWDHSVEIGPEGNIECYGIEIDGPDEYGPSEIEAADLKQETRSRLGVDD